MVFELRGKPFALRDSGRREGVYALCRNWMRGSDDERPRERREVEHPEPPDDSLVGSICENLFFFFLVHVSTDLLTFLGKIILDKDFLYLSF